MNGMTRVECATCGWFNQSWEGDEKWIEHSGWVHTQILNPGHVLAEGGPQ